MLAFSGDLGVDVQQDFYLPCFCAQLERSQRGFRDGFGRDSRLDVRSLDGGTEVADPTPNRWDAALLGCRMFSGFRQKVDGRLPTIQWVQAKY